MRYTTIPIVILTVTALAQQQPFPRIGTADRNVLYWESSMRDRVAELHRTLKTGKLSLAHDPDFGYLPALLKQFGIPVESQILVFSKTSLQSSYISPETPRAIYFNDDVAIAWVRRGPILEVAAHDPDYGLVFYTIDQAADIAPGFTREQVCLDCHHTTSTLGVPGNLVRTVFPGLTGLAVTGLTGAPVDHRTPYEERWGGWYVTGKRGPIRHRANAVVVAVSGEGPVADNRAPAAPLSERFSTSSYLSPYSDIVALTVFEHQVHMMNLIARAALESRTQTLQQSTVNDLVDYMLFVDEAPLTSPIVGSSGFAERFATLGPNDRQGRSLRMLDLNTRILRYPCSYMIYSNAFQSLPPETKKAIYGKLFQILDGKEAGSRYARLGAADRKAIAEILRQTVPDVSGL